MLLWKKEPNLKFFSRRLTNCVSELGLYQTRICRIDATVKSFRPRQGSNLSMDKIHIFAPHVPYQLSCKAISKGVREKFINSRLLDKRKSLQIMLLSMKVHVFSSRFKILEQLIFSRGARRILVVFPQPNCILFKKIKCRVIQSTRQSRSHPKNFMHFWMTTFTCQLKKY